MYFSCTSSPTAYTPHLDGGSPILEENSMLATAVRRAKDAGVPKENIENALLKARTQAHCPLLHLT
jgi:transcriptional/translational regulatory protein YebC/TACO1